MTNDTATASLRDSLTYAPRELAFGTSGLRGLVADLTNLEAWINTTGFLRYLKLHGETVYVAADLRPSSTRRVDGRGEILQAVIRAIEGAGCRAVYLGQIPTPALTYHAMQQACASVMVTGSHIPFDRNGIKFNRPDGEVLKRDEPGILAGVAEVRKAAYETPLSRSIFDAQGMLKSTTALPTIDPSGRGSYLRRYLDFFKGQPLKGRRILVYQHSAVGRDLLVEVLAALGADTVPAGRSETFVPIDTEDIQDAQMARLQELVDAASGRLDAVVSTDGDSDRPLLLSVNGRTLRFHPGDLLGIVVAQRLQADAVAVPVSCNDAVDRALEGRVLPRTRIGSPYVIEAMQQAAGNRVVGFEANGGFLIGSDIDGLQRLPTRDALLPLLIALHGTEPVSARFDRLPARFSRAGLIDGFDMAKVPSLLARMRSEAEQLFPWGRVVEVNEIDGVRVGFDSGDVIHVRPSGNAPQLRVYGNADTQVRADEIVRLGLEKIRHW
ncbi:MAG: phosphohexomutase domain-containing protein [Candidatus Xenobia bacterium]